MTGDQRCQPKISEARQHSPLPWRVHSLYPEQIYCTDDGHQFMVADICGAGTTEQDKVNTAFIVEAVNSHASLKDLLLEASLQIDYLHKKFQETGTGNTTLARIRAALAGETEHA